MATNHRRRQKRFVFVWWLVFKSTSHEEHLLPGCNRCHIALQVGHDREQDDLIFFFSTVVFVDFFSHKSPAARRAARSTQQWRTDRFPLTGRPKPRYRFYFRPHDLYFRHVRADDPGSKERGIVCLEKSFSSHGMLKKGPKMIIKFILTQLYIYIHTHTHTHACTIFNLAVFGRGKLTWGTGSISGRYLPITQEILLEIHSDVCDNVRTKPSIFRWPIKNNVTLSRMLYSLCKVIENITRLHRLVWFSLVSLFNGISAFVGYLMWKQSL